MRDKGNYEAADSAYSAALALRRKLLGAAHPKVAATMKGLARVRHDKGDYASAASLFQEALAIERAALGDEHPSVATTLSYLAWLYHDTGDYDAAFEAVQNLGGYGALDEFHSIGVTPVYRGALRIMFHGVGVIDVRRPLAEIDRA